MLILSFRYNCKKTDRFIDGFNTKPKIVKELSMNVHLRLTQSLRFIVFYITEYMNHQTSLLTLNILLLRLSIVLTRSPTSLLCVWKATRSNKSSVTIFSLLFIYYPDFIVIPCPNRWLKFHPYHVKSWSSKSNFKLVGFIWVRENIYRMSIYNRSFFIFDLLFISGPIQ